MQANLISQARDVLRQLDTAELSELLWLHKRIELAEREGDYALAETFVLCHGDDYQRKERIRFLLTKLEN